MTLSNRLIKTLTASCVVSLALTAARPAHAQSAPPVVQLPAKIEKLTLAHIELGALPGHPPDRHQFRNIAPDFQISVAEPMKKLCFYTSTSSPVRFEVAYSADATGNEMRQASSCFENVSGTISVWASFANKPGSETQWPLSIDLQLYDPTQQYDMFDAPATGTALYDVYPVMKAQSGLQEMLMSDFPTDEMFRQRIFQEAKPGLFRTLKFAAKASDFSGPVASKFTGFPVAGETVVAVRTYPNKVTLIASLDGLTWEVPNASLDALAPTAVKIPAASRRKPSTETGSLTIFAARVLANSGSATSKKWVAAYETHDKCYRAQWDKLDPNGQAAHYVVFSGNGSVADLDAVVDGKVRKACGSAASEKKLRGMLPAIKKEVAAMFAAASKRATARLQQ